MIWLRQEEKKFFSHLKSFFRDCERFLIMYLKPKQRSSHDIDKMDITAPCHFNDIIISMNARVVTYQETVKTGPSGCPTFNEPLLITAKEFYRDISLFTLKEYSIMLTFQASFLLRLINKHKSFASNIRSTSESENTNGVTTIMYWKWEVTTQTQLTCSYYIDASSWRVIPLSDHYGYRKVVTNDSFVKITILVFLMIFSAIISFNVSTQSRVLSTMCS